MIASRAGRQTHLYWEFTVGLVLGCRNAARFPAQKWRYFKAIPAVALSTTPLTFPLAGFKKLPATTKFEEEEMPGYISEDFYPVRMGEVFNAQYQVVSKLGHGVGSTVWLARNLKDGTYRTLKVCIRSKEGSAVQQQADNELAVSDYLRSAPIQQHPGRTAVRVALESFQVEGPDGTHTCLLYSPLGMTFTDLRNMLPDAKFDKRMLQRALQLILIATDYLHKNKVVHTGLTEEKDISPNNILLGARDLSPFGEIEDGELARPIARKVLRDRTVYLSRPVPRTDGNPTICDLGSARIGQDVHNGDIMPGVYRAPEVILGMDWSYSVDVWSIGVMVWDLFEGGRLFFAKKDGQLNDEQHLAEMVALMGNPPPEFLQRSSACSRYWDSQGNWIGSIPIPEQTLELRESRLEGEDKELLLGFMRSVLRWLPEERPTAEELAYDDFLMQAYFAAVHRQAQGA